MYCLKKLSLPSACISLIFLSFFSLAQTRGIAVEKVDPSNQLYTKSYALFIGAENYQYSGWSTLNQIWNELTLVEDKLESMGFDKIVKVIDPTEEELLLAFDKFMDEYGNEEDARIVIFYSGHGFSFEGEDVGYIVPVDAPSPLQNRKLFLQKAIPMEHIVAKAKTMLAKHALFLFDSCFSGTIFQTRSVLNTGDMIANYLSKPVRQFITAGNAGQEVPAKSIFVPALLEALDGSGDLNADGFITGSEVGLYIADRVTSLSRTQSPQFGKIRDPRLDRGEFIFAAPDIIDESLFVQAPAETNDFDFSQYEDNEEIITVTGLGICDQSQDEFLWASDALDVATIMAERNLLEYVVPIIINSETSIENNMSSYQSVIQKFSGTILRSDYQVLAQRYLDEEKCRAQIVISMKKENINNIYNRL